MNKFHGEHDGVRDETYFAAEQANLRGIRLVTVFDLSPSDLQDHKYISQENQQYAPYLGQEWESFLIDSP